MEIRRRVEDGTAHYHGLVRCGSWPSCPVCAAQIAAHRAEEIRQIADAHRAAGGALYLVTLTLPHDQGDRLEPLYHAVADSYRYVRTGQTWKRMKERIGYVGEIRALECTVGANGWHPHLHVLLFTSHALDRDKLDELHAYLHRRWSGRIELCGYRAPSAEHGVTIVESHRDDYLAKMGLADELAQGIAKVGRSGARTPLQVLAGIAATNDAADVTLWREWILAMHGSRQLTWSRGLRERYAQTAERTDLAVVEGESEGAEERVAVFESRTWSALIAANPDIAWKLLDAAEAQGSVGVADLLRRSAPSDRRPGLAATG